MQVMVRWKVLEDQVGQELAMLREVYDELASAEIDGLRYATYRLADGVTFIDVVDLPQGPGMLRQIEAFGRYRAGLEGRCAEPPEVTQMEEVGSYRFP
ncbi:hypothetical protein [Paractinoplanes rishiriensis]|uniref:Uncharacterized protein n=1 Tax=Paractinoplanes rishiriensis TaxID=1050105 RepID=A0A919MS87_9ACTN|nr:hypothetical protein [Actinoplanes rishiriensis]GIE92979.1 hypothetical protein Ari01nite_04440 [Actinoplanes rishiriensis]